LLRLLNDIAGVSIDPEAIDRFPGVRLRTLVADPEGLERLTQVLQWVESAASGVATTDP
jgi:hypothetical protein